jgi:ABC-type multidrug transport system ATPase subunit
MEKILEVKKINKFLDKKQVLFDVSFEVEKAEIYGFI